MSLPPSAASDPAYLSGLNAPQREAVLTTDGPLLVLAGAGTGKTAALTARLAHLIFTRKAYPSEILSVTFTNKAAREMRERVRGIVGDAVEGMPWLGTFHAIAAKMLRRHAELVGLQSNFTILDTDDQLRVMKQLIIAADLDEKRWTSRALGGLFDQWKNKGLSPGDIDASESERFANGRGGELYAAYQTRLKALNACDFGDLLLHVLVILKTHRDVLESYQNRFRYIMVDEYQDTNSSQYLWLRLLAQQRKNICCVGDDDQCLAAGTLITMADGSVRPIEQINAGDSVLSCFGSGQFRAARVTHAHQTTSRKPLVRLTTETGRTLVSSADHIHFCDIVPKLSPQKFYTYLMYKTGVGYRLGTSTTYRGGQKSAVVGFKQYCRQQRADAVWLISAFDSEGEMRACQDRLSLSYGVPTLPFVAHRGRAADELVLDQVQLDPAHQDIGGAPNALQLLTDHRLSPDEPHHLAPTTPGGRKVLNVTLYARHRGTTPVHRISLRGDDPAEGEVIRALGLNARVDRRNRNNWQFESLGRDMSRVDDICTRLSSRFELDIRRTANLLGKPLALRPAASLRPGMVVATATGQHETVVAIEHIDADVALYDLDIEQTHNFVANGIVTHNSIYSWRGAQVENILKFEKDFPGAKVIRLEQNYRSTPHILAAASGVIAHNSGRLGKTLFTDMAQGDRVKVIGVWDGPEEARRVGDEIESWQQRGPRASNSLDGVAILIRAQYQSREFEDRFIAIGMPYRIVGGFRFYERAEIRDALAYLRLVNQPSDDLAFERIVNVPKRGLGDKAVAKVQMLARAQGIPLTHAAARILDTDELTPQARRALGNLVGDIARWRDMAGTMTHADLARTLLDESGYTAALQAEKTVEASGRLENLTELARAMEEYETLGDFLEHVSLVMDNEAAAHEAKVTIMTIHAAKGLEFDKVFLVGWEEGVFPSQRALDEGGLNSLEEERRLAYVAITRARREATILHAANRRIYGQWTSSIPSRFVAELPADHVEHETTMSGGASLWQANWSAQGDPFAHLAAANATRAGTRGPGWQRAAGNFSATPQRIVEARGPAISLGNKGRDDLALGQRVFHTKFGYGTIEEIEGNKLEIEFENAGRKRVLDSFVST